VQDDSPFRQIRPIEVALADLRVKFAEDPNQQLSRMIQQLETEISARKDRLSAPP
jgi:hypothetical protein